MTIFTDWHAVISATNPRQFRFRPRSSQRVLQREQWHSGWLAKLQEISSKPSIQQHIQNAETEPLEIQRTIEEALAASATFCLWDKQMRLLSRTQNDSATKNVPGWTPFRCVDLVHAAAGELTVRIPVPGQNTLPPPLTSHDVTAFCPIKNPGGEVVATLVIQSSVIGKSFAEVVETWNTNTDDSEAFDTYVVDGKGHLLSQNRFPEQLRQVNELVRDLSASELRSNESKGSQNIQGTLIRDPGMNLLGGGAPDLHPANWPLTRAVKGISDLNDGTSAGGYRNYLGQSVVGSWRYLPQPSVGRYYGVAPRSCLPVC